MSLAHYYGMAYMQSEKRPVGSSRMEALTHFGTSSPHAERLAVFAQAVEKLQQDFGSWDVKWGEINRFQRLSGELDQGFDDSQPSLPVGLASGLWGALAAYGQRGKSTTKRIYGTRGNSFVAVVEFGDKVKAKSLLAGGQSGDPSSAHFFDQGQRYVDQQFKDVPYYREEVEARAVRTYHPGE